jgi:hypothetical protein
VCEPMDVREPPCTSRHLAPRLQPMAAIAENRRARYDYLIEETH